MSFHMHLRAVQESEVRHDYAWLTDFMGAAWDWDVHQAEFAAGIAESIEKDFSAVDELYRAGRLLPEGQGGIWELPVFGGHNVDHPTYTRPPFVHLTPAATRQASAFLTSVSFDALWESSPGLHTGFGPDWAVEDVRDLFLRRHTGLRTFYDRTATAGKAVVKAFWY